MNNTWVHREGGWEGAHLLQHLRNLLGPVPQGAGIHVLASQQGALAIEFHVRRDRSHLHCPEHLRVVRQAVGCLLAVGYLNPSSVLRRKGESTTSMQVVDEPCRASTKDVQSNVLG